jgi:serine/threonine protein kinase
MDPAIARTPAPSFVFEDGLGTRHHTTDAGNQPLEVLTLREELTAVPSFEFALRERASRLAGFRHACFGHVRGVDKTGATLAVVSDRVEGIRLSEILTVAEQQLLPVEIDAALCLIRQLVQAVALLHEQVPDVCHGAIAPERLIITPNARLVVVEQALGAALGQLLYSRERYWRDLRIAMPPRAGSPRFDRRADVTQIGAISLALILGRPLAEDDYPTRVAEIVERVGAVSATGGLEPLPDGVRAWLARALQLDPRSSFASAVEARTELDNVMREADYTAAPSALESLLAQYDACLGVDAPPPFVVPPPVVATPAPVATPSASSSSRSSSTNVFGTTAPSPTPAPAAKAPAPKTPKPAAPPAPAKTETHAPVAAKPAPVAPPPSAPLAPPPAYTHVPKPEPAALKLPTPTPEPFRMPVEAAEVEMPKKAPSSSSRGRMVAAAVLFVAVMAGGGYAARSFFMPGGAAAETGTLIVNTTPAGAAVAIDGQPRGTTPLNATLAPGEHLLEILVNEGETRKIPVTITAGSQVSQFIELPKITPGTGKLQVRSEPSGARVTVDGHVFGRAPVTIEGLTPGSHQVTLENDLGAVKETVTIEAGATASLVVPMSTPQGAPVSGWIAVSAPAVVQIFEGGRLLGTSRVDRIMVSAGRHEIEMVNEQLGFRTTQAVQVGPGQTATIRPEWPKGALALNALPWADVFMDGKLIGETPIGNIAVPVGTHEVVFRHPDLGEQRVTTTVTLGAPSKVSVDLRKK